MATVASRPAEADAQERALMHAMEGFLDANWYRARYPDVAATSLDPLLHFIRHGIAERRDPNRLFDSAWYAQHYPDVAAGGLHPLLHYLQSGARALRNPHPRFDAAWYADQYPDSATNPLLYHIRTGAALGYPTERPLDLGDCLASEQAPFPLPRKVVVDVVIPVYRGLKETQRCLASVLADTGKPLGRIIVVDDCSPEPKLSAWIKDLATRREIHLIRNKTNLGFVASANRGMEAAGSHDVVLLNSDTEVPSGWLGRLTAQAYAGPRIASVSPFSNNATICSYPDNNGGPIPFGRTLAEVDEICRSVNAGRWVDVPTTVGFCMYIRRKALDEVGLFDAQRFTSGYGEENDFCLRASQMGWRHHLACDTFVYHKGSVSFGDRTNILAARALQLLLERYPNYLRDVARHVSLGAVVPYRFAVSASILARTRLPVVLMVSHALGGGVRRHIQDLVDRFRDQARFLLLEATDRGAALSILSLPQHPPLSLAAEAIVDLVPLLRSFNVARVHIHHLLGMDRSVQTLIRRLRVPFDVTVHDYFAICPQINLLPWRHGVYCGEPDLAGCNACIANRSSHGARDIVTWRADLAWQFKDADRVFCPSLDVLARLRRFGLDAKAVFAPHEAVAAGPWPMRVTSPRTGKLKIAVLGTLADHKGGRTVASVVDLADPDSFEFHLIGGIDGPFSETAAKRLQATGRYDDDALPELIKTIGPHLIWFPAAWPETFSYTLSAAINAGVPIAATRIGAHTERLAGRPFTWLTDAATSPAAWIALFGEIRTGLLKKSKAGAMPQRSPVADFHGSHYLSPRAAPRLLAGRSRRSRPRVVVVPERFDTGVPTPCAYIRLLQPLHHPDIAGDLDVRLVTAETVFDHDADIIVTQRFAIQDMETANRLAAHARSAGATLVYDLDDDLLAIPRSHPDAALLRPRAKVARRVLDAADVVWLSTSPLADRLAPIRPDATVIENGLDERIWRQPPAPSQDQPVRILCMGTTTHDRDLAMIEPALSRLKAEYHHRVAIDVIGMSGRDDLVPGVGRIIPPANAMRSYPGFVNWLTSAEPHWHIGLAPLLDTSFNLCKSAIKAMDYAAMGLTVLASDIPVYHGSVADGPAGQLVPNTAAAWYAALNGLLRDWTNRPMAGDLSRTAFLARASLASQAAVRRTAWSRLIGTRRTDAAA